MAKRLVILLLAAAAIAALAVFGLSSSESPGSKRPAPALPTTSISGPAVTLPGLLAGAGGRPVAVVFWASWCRPCEREAPAFERFARGSGRDRLVGVDWSDVLGDARTFISRYGWTFPNLRDAEGTVGYAYRITTLPTTFVVGADRRIVQVLHGPQTVGALEDALRAAERSA